MSRTKSPKTKVNGANLLVLLRKVYIKCGLLMNLTRRQEPITRSLHLPYKPYKTAFARIFLFLQTAGLLDSRALYAQYTVQYKQHNKAQLNKAQHIAMHYTICFLGNLSYNGVKSTVLKIERYAQMLSQGYMGDGGSACTDKLYGRAFEFRFFITVNVIAGCVTILCVSHIQIRTLV